MNGQSAESPEPELPSLMDFRLPRVYPITDVHLAGVSQAEQVSRLAKGGATLVQLRDKDGSSREFFLHAKEALRVARRQGVRIIVNDRVDIALTLNADGVHLGQDDLPPEAARQLLGDGAVIGFSTHNLEQAMTAAKLPIDYLAVGPIFITRTKIAPDPPIGLEGLRTIRAAIGAIPLVAIGGITAENGLQVLSAGADAVAVIGDLFSSAADIKTNMERLVHKLEKAATRR